MGESGVTSPSDGGDTSSEPTKADGANGASPAGRRRSGEGIRPRPTPTATNGATDRKVINVDEKGDIILDVVFETSSGTLNRSRKAELAAFNKAGNLRAKPPASSFKPTVQAAYRVDSSTLRKASKYFTNLLSNPQFAEASKIERIQAELALMNLKTSEATPTRLPWISITDDDEASQTAGREVIFEDLLRIIHSLSVKTTKPTMSYVTTLAIFADRFDCKPVVSKAVTTQLRFKWPITTNKSLKGEHEKPTETEKVLRQKIFIFATFGAPMRLQQVTKELIVRGSYRWSPYLDESIDFSGAWWNLPDGIEGKVNHPQIEMNFYTNRDTCRRAPIPSRMYPQHSIFRPAALSVTISLQR